VTDKDVKRYISSKLLLDSLEFLPVREEAKMREDTGANHFHVDVQVQDGMREFGLWYSQVYMVLLGLRSL
jgi:hypothetical protein